MIRIFEILALDGEKLDDARWCERFGTGGLNRMYCLLGNAIQKLELVHEDCLITLGPQEVLLLPPGQLYVHPSPGAGFVGAVFFTLEDSGSTEAINMLTLLTHANLILTDPHLQEQFSNFYRLFRECSLFSGQAVEYAVLSYLYLLAEKVLIRSPDAPDNAYVKKALDIMSLSLEKSMTLPELTKSIGISEAHFIRLFRTHMHMPPMQYYMHLKIQHAASLLLKEKKTGAVARQLGFYNESHFSKQFKKHMGISPSEYRSQYTFPFAEAATPIAPFPSANLVLNDFIDAISDRIFVKDIFHVYRICNQAFCEYFGRSKADIIGHTDFNIHVDREHLKTVILRDQEVFTSRRPMRVREDFLFGDGSVRPMEVLKYPYISPTGELLGVIGVCRDIPETLVPDPEDA